VREGGVVSGNGCGCEALRREFEALRNLLEATAQPRLSVQHKDAPGVLGIGKTSFVLLSIFGDVQHDFQHR
jgi:hypothetical protein